MLAKKELLNLVKSGRTDREIAEISFCSESTIQRLRAEYGIGRYVQIHDRGRYLRMKSLNLTDEQISYVLGVSRRALSDWKRREGLVKTSTK